MRTLSCWPGAARALLASSLVLVALASVSVAHAAGSYLSTWQSIYPASASASNADCQLCHADSTQQLNPYGGAICSSTAGSIGNRIRAVEGLNSDSDPTGATNLEEVTASTQPGWTPGNVNATYSRGDCSPSGLTEAPPTYITGDLDPAPGNQPPTADPSGPYSGTVGVAVTFDGRGSSDPDGSIVTYQWDFGDGGSGTGLDPSHTYQSAGAFTVALTVTDDGGETDTATTTANIGLGNQPPVADANGPYSGLVGEAITFDGTGSNDPDGSIASYDWDFGDGGLGSGATPTHTYANPGTFNVTLTVTDDANATDSAASTVTIAAEPVNAPPTADPGGPYSGTAGVQVDFDGTGSSDPDGSIVTYAWNFGDGNTGSGASPSHIYVADGSYTVSLTVTDNAGDTSNASTTANIGTGNEAPVADPMGPYSGTVGVPVSFDGSGSSDPDGSIATYSWDFGDGGTGDGPTPSHAYAADGSYDVSLTVTDNGGAMGTAGTTADIGTGNLPPVADAGGPYSGTAGLPVTFDGGGSSDPDGSIVAYRWDFGDGTTAVGRTPEHVFSVPGLYHVTLEVMDANGATDSAMTMADISEPATTVGDASLVRLITPRVINLRVGETGIRNATIIAEGTDVAQSASVNLTVASPPEVAVEIPQASASLPASTDGGTSRYRLTPAITCQMQGLFRLTWTATLTATSNGGTGNDTLTETTEVRCMGQRRGGKEDDEVDEEMED